MLQLRIFLIHAHLKEILIIKPWSKVLIEKLTVAQLAKKCPAFLETEDLSVTVFTEAPQWAHLESDGSSPHPDTIISSHPF
jgi:hypothetical protein